MLGSGGTGVVYLATKLDLSRLEALKVLAPELATTRFRQRLAREWRLAASLEHPNILPVFDAGEADGQAYLAMQYVEGGDLLAELTRLRDAGAERAVAIVPPGRARARRRRTAGLVHRDVAPANILLDADDRAHLAASALTRGASFLGYVRLRRRRSSSKASRSTGAPTSYASAACSTTASPGRPPFVADDEGAVMRAHLLDTAAAAVGVESRPAPA